MPSKTIDFFCYIIANSRGTVRTTKYKPSLGRDEVAIRLAFKLPEVMFARPVVQAQITVSEAAVAPKDIAPEILINTAALIEQQLGIKVELVVVPPEE
jgi:hypothetical protein